PGCGPTEVVQYLIFELADGDARRQADEAKRYDSAWALKTLHQVAVGLTQLHRELIAHQDLKPSNVLTFGARDTKIADLGRAAAQHTAAPHEHVQIAGDRSYAPPECLYREPPHDWLSRRVGCDQYLLGSLVASFFLGSAITPLVQAKLDPSHRARGWAGDYTTVLPYVRFATEEVLADMVDQMPADVADPIRSEIIQMVRQLCEPDCSLRGHPLDRMAGRNQRSLQRYVSAFDRLGRAVAIRRP
ncbi:MAG: protein kinase, partial [Brevundimonas sp.]|uniref:protein kinase domain-containing protein n=1 Tax=Brevundimonas sp. TaxID=1871086 RepID=UPI002733453F